MQVGVGDSRVVEPRDEPPQVRQEVLPPMRGERGGEAPDVAGPRDRLAEVQSLPPRRPADRQRAGDRDPPAVERLGGVPLAPRLVPEEEVAQPLADPRGADRLEEDPRGGVGRLADGAVEVLLHSAPASGPGARVLRLHIA
jgi:hypothetical protein